MLTEDESIIEARADSLYEATTGMMDELVAARKEHGLSQEEVGFRMGISQSAVSQLERSDANPTLDSVRRYALAVGARLEIKVVDDLAASRVVPGTWTAASPAPDSELGNVDWISPVKAPSTIRDKAHA